MTKDKLVELINDPTLLSSITYEELKTLVLSYPYAHNLRVLLALKAKQDKHPNHEKDLSTASLYSLDRRRLFSLMAPKVVAPQVVKKSVKEEVLELKPIKEVEKELRVKQPAVESAPAPIERKVEKQFSQAETPTFDPPLKEKDVIFDFSEALRKKQSLRKQKNNEHAMKDNHSELEKQFPEGRETIEKPKIEEENAKIGSYHAPIEPNVSPKPNITSGTSALEKLLDMKEEKQPTPTLSVQTFDKIELRPVQFESWSSGFNLPSLKKSTSKPSSDQFALAMGEDEDGLEDALSEENQTEGQQEARKLAQKSVSENQGIVSETLAKLYVRQGHKDKAINMYNRLCLAFPEKSAFFAAQIKNIQESD